MRVYDIACPVCNADVPMGGDERPGEEIFCTFCGAPLRLEGNLSGEEECSLEEDF
jgi:hypothetical protein